VAQVSEPAPVPPAAPAAVLEAREITKLYGGLRAVDGVSFSVAPGEVLGIAGPNGAGKTTLFDTITGHTIATDGEIVLAGEPIRGTKIHHRCRLGLARTFQHPVAADTLTVLENAYLAASFRRGRAGRRSRSDDVAAGQAALDRVGLRDRAMAPASLLPVYDRKRLMIATALATDPLVLLLDEPFGGLSLGEIDETMGLIGRIRDSGVAIVCIEHVMRALVALADRVLVMHHGAEIFLGTPAEMLRDQRVVEVYLGAGGSGAA
jgi:branched-chain amino acid transport system ATP-binding protein